MATWNKFRIVSINLQNYFFPVMQFRSVAIGFRIKSVIFEFFSKTFFKAWDSNNNQNKNLLVNFALVCNADK